MVGGRLSSLRAQLGVVTATVFFSSLAFDLFNGTLPVYLQTYRGFSVSLVGVLLSVASITQVFGSLLAGPFIDSRGARLTLRLGPFLYLPAAAVFAASHDPFLLGVARVLQTTGFLLVLPAAYSLLPGMVSIGRRATGLAMVGMANTVALGIAPPVGVWLMAQNPLALFGASAISGLLALAVGLLLIVGARAPQASAKFSFHPSWFPFLVGCFLAFVNWGLLLTFLPLQLETRLADVGWFLAADALALTVLRLPAGYANDRWGGRRMALLGLVINLAALALLLQSRSLPALVAAGLGTGAAASLLLPAIQLELSLRSAENERGTAMALASAAFALALAVGTLGGTLLVNRAEVGFQGALLVVTVACAAAALPILLARGVALAERAAPSAPSFAGMTPDEARIAAVWMEVLGLEQVGREEPFLELGGQSLQAIQIASRLSEAFDAEVPLVHVFDHPTVAASALAIEALVAVPDHHGAPHVAPAPPGDTAPASFAQERMWFLQQLDPGTAAYNVPFALRFSGELDVDALEVSLERLVARQEALRTRLVSSGGEVTQVVMEPQSLHLAVSDLSGRPEAEREVAASRILEADVRQAFDLARGPLNRIRLLRLSELEHILMLTLHHSVCDDWSRRVLVRELAAGYLAATGQAEEPAAPGIRYRDFAAWQREQMLGQRRPEELEYWSSELGGTPASLDLPTDRPRPAERTYLGGSFSLDLPPEVAEGVHELSRRLDATPFMTLLTVFAVLLQRHSGESLEDLVIGSPVANRILAETEELVGCFVNTLALRVRLQGDPTFETLLGRVRQTCLAAYSRSELPFEQLVERLHPDRDMSRTPLFQVMFDMELPTVIAGFPAELAVAQVPVAMPTSLFDLTLTIAERPNGMTAVFEYSADLFDESSVERIARRWVRLLDAVVEDPGLHLSELKMVPDSELQLLAEFSRGPVRRPGLPVYRRVEAHAARNPAAAAVSHEAGRLTYSELNGRANQLARHLVGCGAGPERLVGICLDRSPEFVTTVLAVHKAAAAYVPLDPGQPAARLAMILDDARPAVVATESRLLGLLPAGPTPIVCIDRDQAAISRLGTSDLAFEPAVTDLAYVIHTSGSTGRPKGVMVTQEALSNWADAAGRAYGLDGDDRVLQFHSIGFDASVGDVFCTLAAGSELVIADDAVRMSPAAFLQALPRLRPTVADLPTAYWHELVDELEVRPVPPVGLRLVIIGGEGALPEKMRRWQRYVDPRIRLANSYGPTESTVVSTLWWLNAGFADQPAAAVPIGRPVDNVRAYVLDPNGRTCPIGVRGEIYLGGAQLAAGYLNLPEETRSRFLVRDPLGVGRHERLYRTGDLAAWLASGDLQFMGRADRQVKIRGVRIELEEVESVMASHPEIAESVVEPRERVPGELQLAAYVVLRPGSELTPAGLRRHLETHLPAHAVPALFVRLSRLPLTPSGKVDRRALPEPVGTPVPAGAINGAAPAGPIERQVAAVWAEVLGLAGVSRTDDFFELGGHSLLAARMVSRLRKDFEIDLPVKAVFESPTVSGLAGRIELARNGAVDQPERAERRA
jgi:amino acid adenylation domain-containing protein